MSKCQNQNIPQLQNIEFESVSSETKCTNIQSTVFRKYKKKHVVKFYTFAQTRVRYLNLIWNIANIWGGSDGLEKVLRILSQIKFHLGEGPFLVKTWFSDNFSPWWQLQAFVNFSFWSLLWMGPRWDQPTFPNFPKMYCGLKIIFFHDNS